LQQKTQRADRLQGKRKRDQFTEEAQNESVEQNWTLDAHAQIGIRLLRLTAAKKNERTKTGCVLVKTAEYARGRTSRQEKCVATGGNQKSLQRKDLLERWNKNQNSH
jgi:hypothetical protein